jgi:hypothetical protein
VIQVAIWVLCNIVDFQSRADNELSLISCYCLKC